jgi:hypothetical protein
MAALGLIRLRLQLQLPAPRWEWLALSHYALRRATWDRGRRQVGPPGHWSSLIFVWSNPRLCDTFLGPGAPQGESLARPLAGNLANLGPLGPVSLVMLLVQNKRAVGAGAPPPHAEGGGGHSHPPPPCQVLSSTQALVQPATALRSTLPAAKYQGVFVPLLCFGIFSSTTPRHPGGWIDANQRRLHNQPGVFGGGGAGGQAGGRAAPSRGKRRKKGKPNGDTK